MQDAEVILDKEKQYQQFQWRYEQDRWPLAPLLVH